MTLPPPPVASTHVRTHTLDQKPYPAAALTVKQGSAWAASRELFHIASHPRTCMASSQTEPPIQHKSWWDHRQHFLSDIIRCVGVQQRGSICYIGVIVCGLRRWRWAHSDLPLQMPWMLVVVIVVTLERLFHVLQGAFKKLMVSWKKWGGRCVLLHVRSDGEWRAWLSLLPASHCYTIPTANPGQLIRNSLQ